MKTKSFFLLLIILIALGFSWQLQTKGDAVIINKNYILILSKAESKFYLYSLSKKLIDTLSLNNIVAYSKINNKGFIVSNGYNIIYIFINGGNIAENKIYQSKDPILNVLAFSKYVILRTKDKYYIIDMDANSTIISTFNADINISTAFKYGNKFIFLSKKGIIFFDKGHAHIINASFNPDSYEVSNGILYISSYNDVLYKIDLNKEIVLWDKALPHAVSLIKTSQDGLIIATLKGTYILTNNGQLIKIDEVKSDVIKSFRVNDKIYAYFANVLYVFTSKGVTRRYVLSNTIKDFDVLDDIFVILYENSLEVLRMKYGCVITSPAQYSIVGYYPFNLTIRALSNNAKYRINNAEWVQAKNASIDPIAYDFGLITIECNSIPNVKYGDKITITRDRDMPMRKLKIRYPKKVKVNERFSILVYDENGKQLKSFKANVNGKEYKVSYYTLRLSFKSAGKKNITIIKEGFYKKSVIIEVESEFPILLVAIIIIIIIIIIIFLKIKGFI